MLGLITRALQFLASVHESSVKVDVHFERPFLHGLASPAGTDAGALGCSRGPDVSESFGGASAVAPCPAASASGHGSSGAAGESRTPSP
eukprot:6944021-Pyramimonas_sp.AAC.1